MKSISRRGVAPFAFFSVLALTAFSARAQSTQYWIGDSGTGGNGTWDTAQTPDWNGPSTWQGGSDLAFFNSTAGTVTVDNTAPSGPVTTAGLEFSAPAGDYHLTGGDITQTAGSGNDAVYLDGGNSSNVVIDNNLVLNGTYNDQYNFQNFSSGQLTLNGNITVNNALAGGQQIKFDAGPVGTNGAGEIVINGSVAGPSAATGAATEADFGFGGGSTSAVYVLGANANFSGVSNGINIANGTILVDGPTFTNPVTIEYGLASVLTNSAMTYSGNIEIRGPGADTQATVGGNTADISTYTGSIHMDDDQNLNVSAAAGGRVYFTGSINGAIPNGVGKTGDGTVVFGASTIPTTATTPPSVSQWFGTTGGVQANLQAGTTLITNGAGTSAFGGTAGTVNLGLKATLGGTGFVSGTQQVVAAGSSSVLTAGDPGQANLGIAPAIGQLTLAGGLSATNGLTLDFKLDGNSGPVPGEDNDLIVVDNSLTLGGTVNVNFTSVGGTVATGEIYTLMQGQGADWEVADGTIFNVTAPTGYTLDTSYNNDLGYDFNTDNNTFTAEFVATPEPSTWAMLAGGLVLLVAWQRRRLRS